MTRGSNVKGKKERTKTSMGTKNTMDRTSLAAGHTLPSKAPHVLTEVFIKKLGAFCGNNKTVFCMLEYVRRTQADAASVRRIVSAMVSATKPPYQYQQQFVCQTSEQFQAHVRTYCSASADRHARVSSEETRERQRLFDESTRAPNGLSACVPCSQRHKYPRYTMRRDGGHACKSNGGKANTATTHCGVCTSLGSV